MASIGGVTPTPKTPKGTSISSATTDVKGKKKTGTNDMGKDDFLKLMLTQLKNQDPLKPMDDQAFAAQTAQFNALDEMTKVNKTLATLLQSQQLAEASGMIGHAVSAIDVNGKAVTGIVTGASVEKNVSMLHVGDAKIAIDKVSAVAADVASLPVLEPATDPNAADPKSAVNPKSSG